jgi:protein transport protein SEC20
VPEKTDWLDRVLIISALVIFGLVVLFILKSRIIDRGLRIAFFWTRLLPSSTCGWRGLGDCFRQRCCYVGYVGIVVS